MQLSSRDFVYFPDISPCRTLTQQSEQGESITISFQHGYVSVADSLHSTRYYLDRTTIEKACTRKRSIAGISSRAAQIEFATHTYCDAGRERMRRGGKGAHRGWELPGALNFLPHYPSLHRPSQRIEVLSIPYPTVIFSYTKLVPSNFEALIARNHSKDWSIRVL